MPPEKQPAQEFQVTDRRRFSDTGERREGVDEEPPASKAASPQPAPPAQPAPPKAAPAPQASRPGPPGPPPPPAATTQRSAAAQQAASSYEASGIGMGKVGFDRVVMTYAQTAMLQLGLLAPEPGQPLEPDIYGARETIDALGVIQEKTRGNLTPQEEQMLESTLFELRMAWMEVDRRYGKAKQK